MQEAGAAELWGLAPRMPQPGILNRFGWKTFIDEPDAYWPYAGEKS